MAWRFKASKYKNAAPIVPKMENTVRDICIGSYQTYGNNIAASGKFMAFNWDHAGSSLAVLPLDDSGRKSKLMPLLHAHTDTVTDMDFSPFHDGLLATGSQDCLIKIWNIPEGGLQESLSNPECVFSYKQKRVETVGFHPIAEFLLHSTSYTTLNLWDLISEKEIFSNQDHMEVIQSVSWKRDGTLLATSCKDKQVRIIDPRIQNSCVQTGNGHQSIKDSRIVWLGETDKILTTGFDAQRSRQIMIRDVRKFGTPEKSLELDCSTGILMPLYDSDTGMLFLAGKGDSTIGYMEVTDKEPYLVEGIRHSGEQTKGACLVPKRALNVMQGEVNRIMQLTSTSVIPIMYQVPRKTYRDFHGDLYPETAGYTTEIIASDWMEGKNIPLPKISLDPAKKPNGDNPIVVHKGSLSDLRELVKNRPKIQQKPPPPAEKVKIDNIKPPLIQPQVTEQPELSKPTVPEAEPSPPPCDESPTKGMQDAVVTKDVVPPKPLPRTSRAGSVCDSPDDAISASKPIARPRTNSCAPVITSVNPKVPIAGGYKPRLGPKPFTPSKSFESTTFERSFSVPSSQPFNSQSNGVHEKEEQPQGDSEQVTQETVKDDKETEQIDEGEKSPDVKGEEDDEVNEPSNNFERDSLHRTSIAERRRMYENRSQSVQEEVSEKGDFSPAQLKRKNKINEDGKLEKPDLGKKIDNGVSTPTPKRTSTVFGRVSKFRHLKGTPAHKSFHIENIRNISRQISGECDGFAVNPDRVAVPLSGPGGKIAIFELSKTGRLPDGVIPALVNGNPIMDFTWDPFDNQRLAVACDDGTVRLWRIPETGLQEPTNVFEKDVNAHPDKIYWLKFHPTAQDVLATGSYDMTVKIWDLNTLEEKILLKGHSEQIFSFAWSPNGSNCATMSKDGKVRIYQPRNSENPIKEGKGPVGSRGARVVWTLDGNYLVVTGFDKVSERQITIFKSHDLNNSLNTVGLDVSPAILIPFYDEDSSTLFLTGKGDLTVYAFEITEESPYICPLSHHRCNSLHQGLAFLPKHKCDVGNVEFAKAFRLTNNSIEPVSFTVPRIKTELFQDDLFPPTRVTWEPTMTSSEWFSGKNIPSKRISLRPEGMGLLSETQNASEKTINKSASQPFIADLQYSRLTGTVDIMSQTKAKQEEIQKTLSNKLEINLKLEQDDMEGVDAKEWDE
nr:coronin-7 isoform X1 [Onthophagus taurus]